MFIIAKIFLLLLCASTKNRGFFEKTRYLFVFHSQIVPYRYTRVFFLRMSSVILSTIGRFFLLSFL